MSTTSTPVPISTAKNSPPMHYHLAQTRFGLLLVVGNDKGISLVTLSDQPSQALEALQGRFSPAQPCDTSHPLISWGNTIGNHLDTAQPLPDLPLNVLGTPFQQQVWSQLNTIPWGSTCTYGELATRLGKPGASRAVGAACASNNLAIVIPCHRVVGAKGQLGGYRWGVQRKAALLAWERAHAFQADSAAPYA